MSDSLLFFNYSCTRARQQLRLFPPLSSFPSRTITRTPTKKGMNQYDPISARHLPLASRAPSLSDRKWFGTTALPMPQCAPDGSRHTNTLKRQSMHPLLHPSPPQSSAGEASRHALMENNSQIYTHPIAGECPYLDEVNERR